MNDLISRQAAIDAWKEDFKSFVRSLDMPRDDYKGILEYVDEVPSAHPEVLHCADCDYRKKCRFPPQYDERDYCEKHEKVVQADQYCSWAERRQETA